MWFNLLATTYGLVGGRLQAGGREGSAWWREIINIRDGVGSVVGTWFPNNLNLKVGNRVHSLFWFDRWVGDVFFQVRLGRLFEL